MKNIHILPTENESRLRYNSFNKVYELCEFPKYHTDIKSTHNIYITSDEEIKEEDWVFDLDIKRIVKADSLKVITSKKPQCWYYKKIILTTDQDLIKDGVQAIDDEFLEWFVKNPSCEYVKIGKGYFKNYYEQSLKIIIPKEEPKNICIQTGLPCGMQCLSEEACNSIRLKQETLEEAAEKFAKKFGSEIDSTRYYAFINGAKWQAERMYSEEDLNQYSDYVLMCSAEKTFKLPLPPKKWFEQFKNINYGSN